MTEFTLSYTAPILAIDLGKFNSMCCFFDPDTGADQESPTPMR